MLRSVVAVIVGFIVINVLTLVTVPLIGAIFPASYGDLNGALPAVGWIIFNLAYGALFAAVGGYVTAWIARRAEIKHALALGAVIIVLGIGYAIGGGASGEGLPTPPMWYLVILPISGFAGAWLGGWLRARTDQLR